MLPEATLSEAIDLYNEYRGSMATATLLKATDRGFRVRFEGPFCRMCCRDTYFQDLRYDLEDCGVEPDRVRIEAIDRNGTDRFLVEYAVEEG